MDIITPVMRSLGVKPEEAKAHIESFVADFAKIREACGGFLMAARGFQERLDRIEAREIAMAEQIRLIREHLATIELGVAHVDNAVAELARPEIEPNGHDATLPLRVKPTRKVVS